MENIGKEAMFVINVQEEEAKCTESQLDILLKIHCGQYRLVKKKKRSTVWNVYREIARPDGSKLKWRYYCLGCKRVMQSTGGTTSNLRIHKCHMRYLKQHGMDRDSSPQPQRNQHGSSEKKQKRHFEELYDEQATAQSSEADDDYEDTDFSMVTNLKTETQQEEMSFNSSERPLLKFFSEEESQSWSPEMSEVQPTIVETTDHDTEEQSQDYCKETIKPHSPQSVLIDASAISEAESYARAWAHAFLKLSEDQKFYAKRSIDELLVLGRLERLNISTVTSLTTNL